MISSSPKDSEVEITLIGTGGGYGECLIIKLAIDSWIVIDSCINPNTGENLALEYINKIGIKPQYVKLIVCTHWHDDHIRGISNLLRICMNAKFCFSAVTDLGKFLRLCKLDYSKAKKGSIGSTIEFNKCISIIDERKTTYLQAQSDLLIYRENFEGQSFELFSLSPSPKTIENFNLEISELITEFGQRSLSIPNKTPNEKSIAILLKFGKHRVILGADLEIGKNDNEGWRHIIKNCLVVDDIKAKLYKIPHHGSENGYISDIFDSLLNKDCVLKLTPWNRKDKLPVANMVKTYLNHSELLFITSPIISNIKPKKRDKSIEKIIERFSINVSEVKFEQGIVRSRISYLNPDAEWETEIFDAAFKINDSLMI